MPKEKEPFIRMAEVLASPRYAIMTGGKLTKPSGVAPDPPTAVSAHPRHRKGMGKLKRNDEEIRLTTMVEGAG